MPNRKTGKKIAILTVSLLLLGLLTGCADHATETEQTTMTIAKDRSVTLIIVEDFTQDYYSQSELQEMILKEAAAYNNSHGADDISVEKVEVKDQKATVVMQFATPQAYAAYNNQIFFCGTVEEAVQAGYAMDVPLLQLGEVTRQIGRDELMTMADSKLIIAEESQQIRLPGEVQYASEGVIVSGKGRTVMLPEEQEGMAYIIYK